MDTVRRAGTHPARRTGGPLRLRTAARRPRRATGNRRRNGLGDCLSTGQERRQLDVLDNPVWWALTGPQRDLGSAGPLAARFDPEVSPFGAFSSEPTGSHWEELAELAGPGGTSALVRVEDDAVRPPPGWALLRELHGVQMIGQGLRLRRVRSPGPTGPDDNRPANIPVRLTVADVGDMLELVGLAQPGPFLERTVELGAYLGIRRQGRLVAMAGERFHPPGYSEISAVATHPDHRRQGLAELLVGAAATAIAERGDTPFLHASAGNTNAIRLYESMGFAVRRTLSFAVVQAPDRS